MTRPPKLTDTQKRIIGVISENQADYGYWRNGWQHERDAENKITDTVLNFNYQGDQRRHMPENIDVIVHWQKE
jgi:hypothetical protein